MYEWNLRTKTTTKLFFMQNICWYMIKDGVLLCVLNYSRYNCRNDDRRETTTLSWSHATSLRIPKKTMQHKMTQVSERDNFFQWGMTMLSGLDLKPTEMHNRTLLLDDDACAIFNFLLERCHEDCWLYPQPCANEDS